VKRWLICVAVIFLAFALPAASGEQKSLTSLELSRPVRDWEFLSAVGTRAGLFGNEAGRLEAWVYPLKIIRNFHLLFHTQGRVIPAESLARTVTVRSESSSILYASDDFQVRETWLVPVDEPGAVITIEVNTAEPLEVEASFQSDFQLEWPAALGGIFQNWDSVLRAFSLGEEQKTFAALVGSPTAVLANQQYATNYSSSSENSFLLGPTKKGKETKVVVIAGSVHGVAEASGTYQKLASAHTGLLRESAEYYRKYLDRTVKLTLPDAQLQQAYDWARISMVQGLVTNPYLGTGLIAGYRTSADTQRPGFAWFFGRDALWTVFALNADGDFATSRTALEFLSKYQRDDGKITHEISQAASLVPWFKNYPYAYASADATPLYIIAMNDYVERSGDVTFAKQKWNSMWNAYQFLRSTYDSQYLPQNLGVGHGWVEGGPLLPVKTELYQSALGVQAIHSLSSLARLINKDDVANDLERVFPVQKELLNQMFWSPENRLFAFALDTNNRRVETPSALTTVPMWFELLDADKSEAILNLLAGPDLQADWGMRIISSQDPKYSPSGYHFGSVWPLFTGWASVGEYRYHRALAAYANLRANALLATDGALGHVTEVLSGDYHEPLSTSSPHQIWSAAMVVSPILRGMLGLESNALSREIALAPHVPYDWTSFRVDNVHVADSSLDFSYSRDLDGITLEIRLAGSGNCMLKFSPALSLHAEVLEAEFNGKRVPFDIQKNDVDQHVFVQVALSGGGNKLRIRVRNDFGLSFISTLPALGSASEGARFVSESWSPDRSALVLRLAGLSGHKYTLTAWNVEEIASVEGGNLAKNTGDLGTVEIEVPENAGQGYVYREVLFHFRSTHSRTPTRATKSLH
jgi:glycogen debranching enzyme